MGGTYSTGALAPGGRRDLKLFVKVVQPAACTNACIHFQANGPDGGSANVFAHVLIGV